MRTPTAFLGAILLAALALAAVPGASATCVERPPQLMPNNCPDGPDGTYDTSRCNVGPYEVLQDASTGYVYAFVCVGSEFDRVCVYYIVLDSSQDRQCVPVPNP